MTVINNEELARQFRVLRQILGMHTSLGERYHKMALMAEISLLGCSTVFCATTFAGDNFFSDMGLSPTSSRIILGMASIMAFFASLFLLLVDWNGQSSRHRDAARKWSAVLSLFRETRLEDNKWPAEKSENLNKAYWEAARNTTEIPSEKFNKLKGEYLMQIEMSKLKSNYPGCPHFLLWFIVRFIGTKKAIQGELKNEKIAK